MSTPKQRSWVYAVLDSATSKKLIGGTDTAPDFDAAVRNITGRIGIVSEVTLDWGDGSTPLCRWNYKGKRVLVMIHALADQFLEPPDT